MSRNQLVVSGEIIALESKRYTPAGVARIAMTLSHRSEQTEANVVRQVRCEIQALAFAEVAEKATRFAVGQQVKIRGFLAQQGMRSRQLIVHINDIILE